MKRRANKRDPAATKADILEVARQEFAERGLHGARVNTIAARTRTSKRGIYYYFGGKLPLYTAVLERAFADMHAAEECLQLDALEPADAMRRIIDFTFDYYDAHPDLIRLVITENIHQARYMARSKYFRQHRPAVIEQISTVLRRGREAGLFVADIDATELQLLISSMCFYRVAGQYTFQRLYGRDLQDPAMRLRHKEMLADLILAFLSRPQPAKADQHPRG